MNNARPRAAAALLLAAVVTGGLVGCSPVAAVKAVSKGAECQSIKRHVQASEVEVKAHTADTKTDPAAYETAMKHLSVDIADAAKSVGDAEVKSSAQDVAESLDVLVTDYTTFSDSGFTEGAAQVVADSKDVKTADAAFEKVCGYQL
ncbi:hypothetical protein EDF46_0891 [Frondihabitans sp. PhB188]|uniref:hypothetical protein n=1 Tax=Frondihabitans sp. PhB188 TaxID=2485200 RepID=UPI000FB78E90|nr:hypothetical protein [Frondihabitans sp. PhB188]ROQ41511.1 hypothetical protein EDF46_0891 [Frondihabitans sp. PhB188]